MKNHYKNQAQIFLVCLLAPFLTNQLYLRLVIDYIGLEGLAISLGVGKVLIANNNSQASFVINKLPLAYLNKNHNKAIVVLRKRTILD